MSDDAAARAEPHPRDRIAAALAGLEPGGVLIGDGGGDSGPPLYDATPQGWIVGIETSFNETDATWRRCLKHRYYVDHVGMGRNAALPMYLEALRAVGLSASLAPLHGGRAKQVVWLDGVFDHLGHRIG